ncbi:MAG: hypothetical protein GF398_16895 [Chitinivibrionales bacterium]|nr:hypothetical protein [Chitinivibrionales bacterium]
MKNLTSLKAKMATDADLKDIFSYFFDHYAEDPQLLEISNPVEDELLTQTLCILAEQVCGLKNVTLGSSMFLTVKGQDFIHGGCMIQNYMANIFYFKDIDAGMAAFAAFPAMNETQIARFSCSILGKSKGTSHN